MPFGQGFLNKWVGVNSKHVVFPPVQEEAGTGKSSSSKPGDSSATASISSKRRPLHVTDGSVKTAGTLPSQYADTQAIRRFNHRKHRRRGLHRTISATDLIREVEGGKHDGRTEEPCNADILDQSTATETASSNHAAPISVASGVSGPVEGNHHPQQEDPSIVSHDDTEGSLKFVSGFFGTENTESLLASRDQQRAKSILNDADTVRRHSSLHSSGIPPHYRSDDASVHSASVHMMGPHSHLDGATVASRDGQSLPPRQPSSTSVNNKGPLLKRTESQESRGGGGGMMGIMFPPNLFAGDNNGKSCRRCSKFENEISTMREDIEYLRNIALQNEYICTTCQTDRPQREEGESLNLKPDGSGMFNLLVKKHKAQLEQLESERETWKNDAQAKLLQFGNLCRDLNEEAAIRNEEAMELHQELDTVREDRDRIAAELEQARAKITQYELNHVQNGKNEVMIRRLESSSLDGVDRAIKTRDIIILDLSARLERALTCVEMEREQQRQRRQIIFPTQRSSVVGAEKEDLNAEVLNIKNSLKESQAAYESLEHEMGTKEKEWMIKFEHMERQLEAARSGASTAHKK